MTVGVKAKGSGNLTLEKRAAMMSRDPKYVYGENSVDYEERIEWPRLRADRVKKLHDAMREDNVAALLLYQPDHIRYATSTKFLTALGYPRFFRYALIPRDASPILFEVVGVELDNRILTAPWLKDRIRPAIIWNFGGPATASLAKKWAINLKEVLKTEGLAGEKVAVDRIDFPMFEAAAEQGIKLTDGVQTVQKAMAVKTHDELQILKAGCAIADAAYYDIRQGLRPGIRENELYGLASHTLLSEGWDDAAGMVVASGGHTYPYLRDVTDKRVRYGDLVIIDLNGHYLGYWVDIARTFVVGKATQAQKELQKRCLEMLNKAVEVIRAGVTSADVAAALPVDVDDQYGTLSMLQFVHGVGMTVHDPPLISRGFSAQYPMPILEGMYMAAETYATDGREGVRLEKNFVVTGTGVEYFDLYPWDEGLSE